MENNSLAYELLQELKRSSKRWFIVSISMRLYLSERTISREIKQIKRKILKVV